MHTTKDLIRIGVVSETPSLATQLGKWLSKQRNFVVAWTITHEQLKATLRAKPVRLVFACRENESPLRLLLSQLQISHPQPIVVVGSYFLLSPEVSIQLVRHGARSFASIPRTVSEVRTLTETLFEAANGSTPIDTRIVEKEHHAWIRSKFQFYNRSAVYA